MRPFLSEELVRFHAERLRKDFVPQPAQRQPAAKGRRGRRRGRRRGEQARVPVITPAKRGLAGG
jgi:hypothetical protein